MRKPSALPSSLKHSTRTSTSSTSTSTSKNDKNISVKKKTKKRKQYVPGSFLECQSLTHVVGFPPLNELVTTPVASEFVKELFLDRFVKEIVKPFQPDRTKNRNQDGSKSAAPTTENNAGYCHVLVGGKLVKKRRITKDKPGNKTTATATATTATSEDSSQPTDEIDIELARKRRIWKENILIGTNQCLRLLENLNAKSNDCDDVPTIPKKDASKNDSVVSAKPSLIVLARDIYPPTMCSTVPVLAKRLKIPLLLLPGKASLELGKALNAKRTSILIVRCGDDSVQTNRTINKNANSEASSDGTCYDKESSDARNSMASFVSFVRDQIPRNTN